MHTQETEVPVQTDRQYKHAVRCEVCGDPLKFIRFVGQSSVWLGVCSDDNCATPHHIDI